MSQHPNQRYTPNAIYVDEYGKEFPARVTFYEEASTDEEKAKLAEHARLSEPCMEVAPGKFLKIFNPHGRYAIAIAELEYCHGKHERHSTGWGLVGSVHMKHPHLQPNSRHFVLTDDWEWDAVNNTWLTGDAAQKIRNAREKVKALNG